MSSPTQRTLARLRADGWSAFVVEKWNPHARVRQDLGGFGDVIAWAPGRGTLIVQATVGAHVADRLAKVHASGHARAWLEASASNNLEVWGWRLGGARGKRKTWQVRRVRLSLSASGDAMVEQEV